MPKTQLSIVFTIALAASLGFVGGYLFHVKFGMELPAARQALLEASVGQRVLDAYKQVLEAHANQKTLSSVKSIEDLKVLQARSKQATLATIEDFTRHANEAEDRREKLMAQLFLPQALKIRDEVNATP